MRIEDTKGWRAGLRPPEPRFFLCLLAAVLFFVSGCMTNFGEWPADTSSETPTDGDGDSDRGVDGDADADIDSDGDTDSDIDGDVDGDADIDADIDGDADVDGDFDRDGDDDLDEDLEGDIEHEAPFVTGLDGTSSARAPTRWTTDQDEAWEESTALATGRFEASHRVSNDDRLLVITGTGLVVDSDPEGTTVEAAALEGPLRFRFEVVEATASRLRVRFPDGLTREHATGFLGLTVSTPAGRDEVLMYLFPGEPGEAGVPGATALACFAGSCDLDGDLTVEGQVSAVNGDLSDGIEVTGEGAFGSVTVDELTVEISTDLPDCPPGYQRDASRADIVLCQRELDDGLHDEVVRVGDIWVDRYEASVWETVDCSGTHYGGVDENWDDVAVEFPQTGQLTTPLFACSIRGVMPSRWLTWFQAQAACAASGKHLITNAEWQAAVAGTHDPGVSGDDGTCLTFGEGARVAGNAGETPGGAGSCISYWGVEDMIGNLFEWTSDWYGQDGDGDVGAQPEVYFGDGFSSVDAAEVRHLHAYFPPAGVRGGAYMVDTRAGAFAFDVEYSPAGWTGSFGFRCAMNYRPQDAGGE